VTTDVINLWYAALFGTDGTPLFWLASRSHGRTDDWYWTTWRESAWAFTNEAQAGELAGRFGSMVLRGALGVHGGTERVKA
jgi:hypothetical protein